MFGLIILLRHDNNDDIDNSTTKFPWELFKFIDASQINDDNYVAVANFLDFLTFYVAKSKIVDDNESIQYGFFSGNLLRFPDGTATVDGYLLQNRKFDYYWSRVTSIDDFHLDGVFVEEPGRFVGRTFEVVGGYPIVGTVTLSDDGTWKLSSFEQNDRFDDIDILMYRDL